MNFIRARKKDALEDAFQNAFHVTAKRHFFLAGECGGRVRERQEQRRAQLPETIFGAPLSAQGESRKVG